MCSTLLTVLRRTPLFEVHQREMMSVINETAKNRTMSGSIKGVEFVASQLGATGGAAHARREAKQAAR